MKQVTLVVHDWGGMIGMTWAVRHPERVARLVILNTARVPSAGGQAVAVVAVAGAATRRWVRCWCAA